MPRTASGGHNGKVRFVPVVLLIALGSACAATDVSSGVEVESVEASRSAPDVVTDAGQPQSGTSVEGSSDLTLAGGTEGPMPTGADGHPALPETVAVVGDSLTLSAKAQIEAELTNLGLEVVGFDARESRRMVSSSRDIPAGSVAVTEILEVADPELWVIALGTNDVGAAVSVETFTADLGQLLSLVPSSASVMWVDTFIRQGDDDVVAANAAIRSAIALRPGSHVIDWYVHGEEPGVVTVDGVHLTTRGKDRFAESIAVAIDQVFTTS